MKRISLVIFFCLLIQPLCIAAQSNGAPKKFQGFLGSYHPFKGTAYGGDGWTEGELIQKAFDFGENAMVSHATYNGYTFAENVENNCHNWNINKLYGMLTPPSEKGVINQPADTDVMHPLVGKAPGMIQGAHRFSEVSKNCPQLTGVIIDDFFNDYPKALTADNLHDIKDALLGRRIDANGNVDRKSSATTPNLKLYIVVYNHQLDRVDDTVLKYVDGVNFWVWKQTENYKNYDDYIDTIRKTFPGKDVISGVYIFNSAQTPPAESIHYIMDHAIDLYDKGKINGLLVFSAIWLSREKSTRERWNDLALPEFLGREYYPFLGEGRGLDRSGAHTQGHNTKGIGISFQGNFELKPPPTHFDAQLAALGNWLRTLREQEGFVNLGSETPAGRDVWGHQDVKSTACPGRHLFDKLPLIRFL